MVVQVGQGLYSLKGSSDRAHCLDDVSGPIRKLEGGICVNAHQRMVTTENDRKLPSFGVPRHDTSYSLAYPGHESRVLHLANRWVVILRDLFELMVSVELNLISQAFELFLEAGFNQVDGTMVYSEFSLKTTK